MVRCAKQVYTSAEQLRAALTEFIEFYNQRRYQLSFYADGIQLDGGACRRFEMAPRS
jgi:hypothetical protein